MYEIKFERRARAELDSACPTYGEEFCSALWAWLGELAEAAEKRQLPIGSVDLSSIAEAVDGDPTLLILKFGAKLWDWLRKKQDGRRLFAARRRFFILNAFSETVQINYQIDHDAKRIIVRMFQGLPGQGE